jgi:hypothetical protein
MYIRVAALGMAGGTYHQKLMLARLREAWV